MILAQGYLWAVCMSVSELSKGPAWNPGPLMRRSPPSCTVFDTWSPQLSQKALGSLSKLTCIPLFSVALSDNLHRQQDDPHHLGINLHVRSKCRPLTSWHCTLHKSIRKYSLFQLVKECALKCCFNLYNCFVCAWNLTPINIELLYLTWKCHLTGLKLE